MTEQFNQSSLQNSLVSIADYDIMHVLRVGKTLKRSLNKILNIENSCDIHFARHIPSNQLMILKKIKKEQLHNDDDCDSYKGIIGDEIFIMTDLYHPFVVS